MPILRCGANFPQIHAESAGKKDTLKFLQFFQKKNLVQSFGCAYICSRLVAHLNLDQHEKRYFSSHRRPDPPGDHRPHRLATDDAEQPRRAFQHDPASGVEALANPDRM